jgi:hypothetical protein
MSMSVPPSGCALGMSFSHTHTHTPHKQRIKQTHPRGARPAGVGPWASFIRLSVCRRVPTWASTCIPSTCPGGLAAVHAPLMGGHTSDTSNVEPHTHTHTNLHECKLPHVRFRVRASHSPHGNACMGMLVRAHMGTACLTCLHGTSTDGPLVTPQDSRSSRGSS